MKGICAARYNSGASIHCYTYSMQKDIQAYHKAFKKQDKDICIALARAITRTLPKAESKIWHRHPVWFLDGNPVVGYSKLKDSVQLLFWSGQSFNEEALVALGSFQAAAVRYMSVSQVRQRDLTRWLKKAKDIQWDYKNIVKRKGVLQKVKG